MALYSYGSTLALPCRSCGGGFKDADPVKVRFWPAAVCSLQCAMPGQVFHDRRFHVRCFACAKCKKPFDVHEDPKAVRC